MPAFGLTFFSSLDRIDRALFLLVNRGMANSFFDQIMPYLRSSNLWIPLYLFLFVFVVVNFRGKGLWWSLFFICTVSLTDIISSRLIKEAFERPRPCMDPEFMDQVRLLLHRCSGGYGFSSSHAANHFGMAAYFHGSFRHILGRWTWIGWLWAFMIGFAQVYVGVHYPLDIIGGAVLGAGIGLALAGFFNKRFGFAIFGANPTVG